MRPRASSRPFAIRRRRQARRTVGATSMKKSTPWVALCRSSGCRARLATASRSTPRGVCIWAAAFRLEPSDCVYVLQYRTTAEQTNVFDADRFKSDPVRLHGREAQRRPDANRVQKPRQHRWRETTGCHRFSWRGAARRRRTARRAQSERPISCRESTRNLYAWERYTRSVLADGHLPLWNPYHFAGIPHLADPQTTVFYPPALLLRWLPVPAYLGWMMALHIWIAGAGTLFAARVLGPRLAGRIRIGRSRDARRERPGWIHGGQLTPDVFGRVGCPGHSAWRSSPCARDVCGPDRRLSPCCVLQFLSGICRARSTLAPRWRSLPVLGGLARAPADAGCRWSSSPWSQCCAPVLLHSCCCRRPRSSPKPVAAAA